MRVRRQRQPDGAVVVELLDEAGAPIAVVSGFLRHLAARACSPNTVTAYAYDLRHLWIFLAAAGLAWPEFRPPDALRLLEHLRAVSNRRPRQRLALTVATLDPAGPGTRLAPTTVNRVLAAVSSFYEYAILAGLLEATNPIEQRPDPTLARVADRHRPFVGRASRQRPVRRSVRVKTVQRVPRPLDAAQVRALLGQLRCRRDRALVLLMLQGGLRPGEALGLHLEDVAYGRRRVVVRHRDDHPKGVPGAAAEPSGALPPAISPPSVSCPARPRSVCRGSCGAAAAPDDGGPAAVTAPTVARGGARDDMALTAPPRRAMLRGPAVRPPRRSARAVTLHAGGRGHAAVPRERRR